MKVSGLLLCMAGMATLCAMDAVVKALGAHLGTFQIALIRFSGAALWLVPYILVTRSSWPRPQNWRRHLLRSAIMVCTACLFFYGVAHLPLAIITALGLSAPLYVSLFGIVFLKERPTWMLGVAILLGVAGSVVMVVSGDFGGGSDITGWIAGLLAPISYAAGIVMLKHHTDDEGAAALTLGTAIVATLVMAPLAIPAFVLPPSDVWPLMGLVGLLGASGFILLTTGLRTTAASAFAIVDYTTLLWAAFYGFVFFAEVPDLPFWFGAALIVAACVLGMRANAKVATPVAT